MPGIAIPGYLVMPDELGSPCESAGEDESQQVSKDHGPTRLIWTQIGPMAIPPLPSIADRRRTGSRGQEDASAALPSIRHRSRLDP
jgi:hypothetical protein